MDSMDLRLSKLRWGGRPRSASSKPVLQAGVNHLRVVVVVSARGPFVVMGVGVFQVDAKIFGDSPGDGGGHRLLVCPGAKRQAGAGVVPVIARLIIDEP